MQRTEPDTARSHAEPPDVQFSVFLPNRVGALRAMLERLAEGGVAIWGLSIVDSTEWSVVRMVCGEPDEARAVLRKHHSEFVERRVLLVELGEGKSLVEVCELLLRAEVNLLFAYSLMRQVHGHPVIVLDVDDHAPAVALLSRHGFSLLGLEDHAEPA